MPERWPRYILASQVIISTCQTLQQWRDLLAARNLSHLSHRNAGLQNRAAHPAARRAQRCCSRCLVRACSCHYGTDHLGRHVCQANTGASARHYYEAADAHRSDVMCRSVNDQGQPQAHCPVTGYAAHSTVRDRKLQYFQWPSVKHCDCSLASLQSAQNGTTSVLLLHRQSRRSLDRTSTISMHAKFVTL